MTVVAKQHSEMQEEAGKNHLFLPDLSSGYLLNLKSKNALGEVGVLDKNETGSIPEHNCILYLISDGLNINMSRAV